jgi:hypothetical protein
MCRILSKGLTSKKHGGVYCILSLHSLALSLGVLSALTNTTNSLTYLNSDKGVKKILLILEKLFPQKIPLKSTCFLPVQIID